MPKLYDVAWKMWFSSFTVKPLHYNYLLAQGDWVECKVTKKIEKLFVLAQWPLLLEVEYHISYVHPSTISFIPYPTSLLSFPAYKILWPFRFIFIQVSSFYIMVLALSICKVLFFQCSWYPMLLNSQLLN